MIADLSGKTALVTGGSQGIGRAISLVLAEQGADVAIGDINAKNASRVAKEVEALGRKALALNLDVTSQQSANGAVADILAAWGRLDILINNAGVANAPGPRSEDDSEADWDVTFDINVKGVMHCTKAVARHFMERRYGKIVNMASIAGRAPRPTSPHYAASKAAVISYTRSMAARFAPYNVNVNGIGPGRVWTPFHQAMMEERQRRGDPALVGRDLHEVFAEGLKDVTPLGREQTPEDVGKLAAFLSSDDARNITGQTIPLDGGMIMV
jgi:NAD(P)-dependent dehydrogenase (short-subunit alcohol dehydrogenase family)